MADTAEKLNPFSAEHTGYGHKIDGEFVSAYHPGTALRAFHEKAHQLIVEEIIKAPTFPCILGQTAIRTDQYSFGAYKDMTDPETAEGVLHDLVRFQQEFGIPDLAKGPRGIFRTSMAAFQEPAIRDDMHGAEALYTLLQNMHLINREHFPWVEGFSNDLRSPDFGFSAGRSAHFMAFFHQHPNVPARYSDITFVVLNSHHVVDAFKATGMDNHARAKAIIRSRQAQPIHPYLGDHRDVEEWRQYALLNADPETEARELELRTRILGKCPFQPKEKPEEHAT